MWRWFCLVTLVALGACGGGGTPTGSRTQPPPTLDALLATPAVPWRNGVVEFSTTCTGSGALQYQWDLGDGTSLTTREPKVGHVYLSGGLRQVSVTCIDGSAQQSTVRMPVSVDDIDLNSVADRTCSSAQLGHGWCIQNPRPSGAGANDLAVVGRTMLWAVGVGGSIQKSTDAGRTWRIQASGTKATLNSIITLDGLVAWAAGADGTVLKTTDGGRTWLTRSLATPTRLLTVVALSDQVAWVAGDAGVFHTTDGGSSWRQLSAAPRVESLAVANERVIWAAPDDASLLRTEDGGANWEPAGPSNINSRWKRVALVGTDVVWATTVWGEVFRSLDGGRNWLRTLDGRPGGELYVSKLVALDRNTAWVTTFFGVSLLTRDGGTSWARHSVGDDSLLSLAVVGTDQAWVANPRALFQTVDGGQSWTPVNSQTPLNFQGVASVNARTAWVFGGSSGLLKTDDGGASWFTQPVTGGGEVQDLAAVGSDVAWAICRCGMVWATDNGGVSWIARPVTSPPALNAVSGPSRTVAWAVGEGGAVLLTTDGGAGWQRADIRSGESLAGVSAIDARTAWAVPATGAQVGLGVFKTTDGGANWERQGLAARYFNKVVAVNASVAWALGRADLTNTSTVYRTTDGGTTWVPVWTPPSQFLLSIQALDGNRALVVGVGGAIYQTSDAGVTWQRQAESLTTKDLNEAAWIDANTAWVIGDDGLILKTLTGGR